MGKEMFGPGSEIDLSRAAAERLGMIRTGVSRVGLLVLGEGIDALLRLPSVGFVPGREADSA